MHVTLFHLMSLNSDRETPSGVFAMVREMVQDAEALGFDASWFAEHHFSNASVCAAPLMVAAHCAAITKRIRLGSAVVVLPLYHPLRVLQEIGMLDTMSGGRALLGLATGHQPHEFRSYNIPLDDRPGMMHEAWDIIEQGLTTGVVDYTGRHYTIPETPIVTRTLNGRMPPVFFAGNDETLMRRAIRSGAPLMVSQGLKSAEQMIAPRAALTKLFESVRGTPGPMPICLQRWLFVTDDPAEARTAAEMMLRLARITTALRVPHPPRSGWNITPLPFKGEPTVDWLLAHAPIGPADRVLEILTQDIACMQPTHLSVYMGFTGLPVARTMKSLERFGEQILPVLRRMPISLAA